MKKKIGGLIAIVAAIGLVIAFWGCVEKETPRIEVPSETIIETPIEALKMIPNSSYLSTYHDLKALRKDKDLYEFFWKGEGKMVTEWLKAVGIPEVGIPVDKLNYLVRVVKPGGGSTLIIGGDFDLEKIRGYLDDAGLKQDTYRGEEIWYRENEGYQIALFKDRIIIGDAKWIIQVMKGEEKPLYDNADVIDVMRKLEGFYIMTADVSYLLSEYRELKGVVVAWGMSSKNISKEEFEQHCVIKFIDKSAAEDFAKKELKEGNVWNVIDEYALFSKIVKTSEGG